MSYLQYAGIITHIYQQFLKSIHIWPKQEGFYYLSPFHLFCRNFLIVRIFLIFRNFLILRISLTGNSDFQKFSDPQNSRIRKFLFLGFLVSGASQDGPSWKIPKVPDPLDPWAHSDHDHGDQPTLPDIRVDPMSIWGPLPDKIEQKFKKYLNPYTLGNILIMVRTRRR